MFIIVNISHISTSSSDILFCCAWLPRLSSLPDPNTLMPAWKEINESFNHFEIQAILWDVEPFNQEMYVINHIEMQ